MRGSTALPDAMPRRPLRVNWLCVLCTAQRTVIRDQSPSRQRPLNRITPEADQREAASSRSVTRTVNDYNTCVRLQNTWGGSITIRSHAFGTVEAFGAVAAFVSSDRRFLIVEKYRRVLSQKRWRWNDVAMLRCCDAMLKIIAPSSSRF